MPSHFIFSSTANNATGPGGGEDQGYLTIALIVGVPCGLIIVVLVCLILIMCCLVLRSAGYSSGFHTDIASFLSPCTLLACHTARNKKLGEGL